MSDVVTGPNTERKETWCRACMGPTNNESRLCDDCHDFTEVLQRVMKKPQGRRVVLSPLRRYNFDIFDLRDEAKVQCPISCGSCCRVWHQVKELAKTNVLEASRSAFTRRGKCPHMTKSGCALSLDEKPIACSTFLCSLAKWVHGGKLSLRTAKRLIEAAGGHPLDAADAYMAANGGIEEAIKQAEDRNTKMLEKVASS